MEKLFEHTIKYPSIPIHFCYVLLAESLERGWKEQKSTRSSQKLGKLAPQLGMLGAVATTHQNELVSK